MATDTDIASIAVFRDLDGLTDHLRAYEVVIDGAVVGRLAPGDSCAFSVAPGHHEIFMKIDWCRSEKVNLQLAAGEIAEFRCAPRPNLITGFYWITFGRHRYIVLDRIANQHCGLAVS